MSRLFAVLVLAFVGGTFATLFDSCSDQKNCSDCINLFHHSEDPLGKAFDRALRSNTGSCAWHAISKTCLGWREENFYWSFAKHEPWRVRKAKPDYVEYHKVLNPGVKFVAGCQPLPSPAPHLPVSESVSTTTTITTTKDKPSETLDNSSVKPSEQPKKVQKRLPPVFADAINRFALSSLKPVSSHEEEDPELVEPGPTQFVIFTGLHKTDGEHTLCTSYHKLRSFGVLPKYISLLTTHYYSSAWDPKSGTKKPDPASIPPARWSTLSSEVKKLMVCNVAESNQLDADDPWMIPATFKNLATTLQGLKIVSPSGEEFSEFIDYSDVKRVVLLIDAHGTGAWPAFMTPSLGYEPATSNEMVRPSDLVRVATATVTDKETGEKKRLCGWTNLFLVLNSCYAGEFILALTQGAEDTIRSRSLMDGVTHGSTERELPKGSSYWQEYVKSRIIALSSVNPYTVTNGESFLFSVLDLAFKEPKRTIDEMYRALRRSRLAKKTNEYWKPPHHDMIREWTKDKETATTRRQRYDNLWKKCDQSLHSYPPPPPFVPPPSITDPFELALLEMKADTSTSFMVCGPSADRIDKAFTAMSAKSTFKPPRHTAKSLRGAPSGLEYPGIEVDNDEQPKSIWEMEDEEAVWNIYRYLAHYETLPSLVAPRATVRDLPVELFFHA